MHSLSAASDVVTRAGALALVALFDPAMRKDRAVLGSVFEAVRAVDLQLFENLKLYLDDPIGVRGWPMSGPAFFGSSPPPVASLTAIARIREARVAAAYGLRKSALTSLEMTLKMPPARLHQIAQALEVYERGVLATIAAQDETSASEASAEALADTTEPLASLDLEPVEGITNAPVLSKASEDPAAAPASVSEASVQGEAPADLPKAKKARAQAPKASKKASAKVSAKEAGKPAKASAKSAETKNEATKPAKPAKPAKTAKPAKL